MAIKIKDPHEDRVRQKIGSYKHIERFKASCQHTVYNLDPESIIDMLSKMQTGRVKASRAMRDSEVIDNVQRRLMQVRLKNQSLRSNIVSHKMKLLVAYMSLKDGYQLIKKYVSAKCAEEFRLMKITTKTDKDNWIDQLFYAEVKFIGSLEVAIKVCDTVIDDIDTEGFSTVNVTQILNLDYKAKYER